MYFSALKVRYFFLSMNEVTKFPDFDSKICTDYDIEPF